MSMIGAKAFVHQIADGDALHVNGAVITFDRRKGRQRAIVTGAGQVKATAGGGSRKLKIPKARKFRKARRKGRK